MSKKILAIYFTQSGQLGDIINQFTLPLVQAGHSVEKVVVNPVTPYPFPWSSKVFFQQMPDCVQGVPTQLQPFTLKETKYDLIILGYQAWFLSPAIPTNSIMLHPTFRAIAKNTPVVCITGARNMWISAMERIKKTLREADAKLVGHIALVDEHPNLISFVTILHWMFSGKRDRYLGIFPRPGVSEQQIMATEPYSRSVEKHLSSGQWDGLQQELIAQKAVPVKYNLMFIESKARRIFAIWAGIIVKKKNRGPWLVAFKYYLLIALVVAAPIILTVDAIFFKPFLSKRIARQKKHYSELN